MSELTQKITRLLEEQPGLRTVEMAALLGISEWQLVSRLPAELCRGLAGEHVRTILEQVAEWGPVTTIVEVAGSVFEVKAALPRGRLGHGYFNLFGQPGQLHGHLKLEAMAHVALLSKPHRGKEAHAMVFYDAEGHCIFKIYLGRDERGELFPEQVRAFNALKELAND
ncbi:heme utilization cystosolic carrier protein HutX [Zobellella iuensis]|uniref:Heme utilization cystosolic carrier protein HutX n=1 Tax=Zobellella iuensis TaxID=2803811 RepID=A0ABS1QWM5_9GAMM|nr:heme utilization cystosolic carrier protein HutX [Zobellella iuensis]MBL1379284.1 heme utilization cystosolic carrier protein HutX [Zobellella iuensis]